MELLTTEELRDHILGDYSKIEDVVAIKESINFKKNIPNADDGSYIYADEMGYHYAYCERGNEFTHKLTDDVFEISFWVLDDITTTAAFDYELHHRDGSKNYREVAFEKQLEYLDMMGENYRKRGEIEIDEILKAYPL